MIFIILFMLPVLAISFLFIYFMSNTMLKWEISRVKTSLIQAENSFNETLNLVKNFSDRIYVNRQIQDILLKEYDDSLEAFYDYTSLSFLDDYLHSYRDISSFRIYTDNQTLLDNSFIVKNTNEIKRQPWYNRALNLKGQPFWEYKTDTITKKSYLSLVRSIWRGTDGKFIGVLVINVNPESIIKILRNQIFETAIAYKNQIIFTSDDKVTADDLDTLRKEIAFFQKNSKEVNTFFWHGEKAGVLAAEFTPKSSSSINFTMMYIIPMWELTRASRSVTISTISIIILMSILSFVVIKLYGNYIDARVKKVQNGINSVVENDFSIPKTIDGNDEFEAIYHNLYIMAENIKNLINQAYKHKLEKEKITSRQNEIRYKMLATQINPHFLFNTLETIRMKSLASGDKNVSTMLKLLASLLRYNLSVSGKPVPLYNELDAVQNYLNIQSYRFGDRISYDIITMCDVQRIVILPLLIQPLVENSFSHGLESKIEGGFIYILISEETPEDGSKLIHVSVKDNGCGIEEAKLNELNEKLKNADVDAAMDQSDSSIGLMNVHSRIRLYYGDKYGMKIKSKAGEGTEITLTFPSLELNDRLGGLSRV